MHGFVVNLVASLVPLHFALLCCNVVSVNEFEIVESTLELVFNNVSDLLPFMTL